MEADGAVTYKINVGPPTGADSKYAALAVVQVELTNTDNETAGITVVPPEPGGDHRGGRQGDVPDLPQLQAHAERDHRPFQQRHHRGDGGPGHR